MPLQCKAMQCNANFPNAYLNTTRLESMTAIVVELSEAHSSLVGRACCWLADSHEACGRQCDFNGLWWFCSDARLGPICAPLNRANCLRAPIEGMAGEFVCMFCVSSCMGRKMDSKQVEHEPHYLMGKLMLNCEHGIAT